MWYTSEFDTRREKRWTWILVLLFIWPQYQAFKLIVGICYGEHERGDEFDRRRERKVHLREQKENVFSFNR